MHGVDVDEPSSARKGSQRDQFSSQPCAQVGEERIVAPRQGLNTPDESMQDGSMDAVDEQNVPLAPVEAGVETDRIGLLHQVGVDRHDRLPPQDAVEQDVQLLDGTLRREPVLPVDTDRSEEHTAELQSPQYLVCRLLLDKNK